MRVLFVSPSNAIGGAEISLVAMARYLHENGHAVFVALPPAIDKTFEEHLKPYVEAFLFVRLMPWNKIMGSGTLGAMKGWLSRLVKSRGGWFNAPFRILGFVRKHRIEIIHTNTIMALDGALAAKMAGIPHFQHLREVTGYQAGALFPMLGQSRPRLFGQLWGLLHSRFIANSYYTQKAYAPMIPTSKIRVVYNAVDLPELLSLPLPGQFPASVGMVANLSSKVKNHRQFIQIAGSLSRQMPELTFPVFGKLPAEDDLYFQSLKQEVLQQNLADKLIFKGVCTDFQKMYSQIGILVHPYPFESFGRISIEAMAHGIPVIAARGGGAEELIHEGENGFLYEVNDPETAVRTICNLLQDPALYQRIASKGRVFALQFRNELKGKDLMKVYQEVLG